MRELDRAGLTPTLPTPPEDVIPPSDDVERAGAADAGGAPAPTLAGHATHTSSSHQAELAQVASALAALRGASDVAFTFVRTRPLPPPWDPAHLPHVLRALSIGALGADRVALRQWIAAARDARHETTGLAADDGTHQLLARWDARLRDALVDVWLEIAEHVLTGDESGDTDAVQRAFERLGEMREARATHEAQLLVTLSGDMVPVMRTYLQILYALADATAHTVVWARRGVTALAVPRARMALASAGTLTAGDRTLDTAYQWLTTALEVPMIVAGLPAPAGTLGERGASVVEPDRHGAPARRRSRG
ncbi:hypothetical protein J421_4013 [Gemmatirosa kalamazoonensis]|uniref:Uncharacterized protein n=1 Tax=Gemmatirosa kalamazoonensis TaxID=861299 RepID=W0RMK0_9BACT|nr:hypothetical protein [Gemmatirosa kalamazoonensis]AHG91550.1 hypothetical protein J421_4013 [Gemmatirosa kalamazoonensis]